MERGVNTTAARASPVALPAAPHSGTDRRARSTYRATPRTAREFIRKVLSTRCADWERPPRAWVAGSWSAQYSVESDIAPVPAYPNGPGLRRAATTTSSIQARCPVTRPSQVRSLITAMTTHRAWFGVTVVFYIKLHQSRPACGLRRCLCAFVDDSNAGLNTGRVCTWHLCVLPSR